MYGVGLMESRGDDGGLSCQYAKAKMSHAIKLLLVFCCYRYLCPIFISTAFHLELPIYVLLALASRSPTYTHICVCGIIIKWILKGSYVQKLV